MKPCHRAQRKVIDLQGPGPFQGTHRNERGRTNLTRVLFKSCLRCSGDRVLECDFYGWYIVCLACGCVTYPEMKKQAQEAGHGGRRTA